MNAAFLLEPTRVALRPTLEKLRYDLRVKDFGAASTETRLPSITELIEQMTDFPDFYQAEWRRAAAETLLLRHSAGVPVPADWAAELEQVSPFGDHRRLADCLQAPCACGIFPLATDTEPGLGHVWIFEGRDTGMSARDSSINGQEAIPPEYGMAFVNASDGEWRGRSWQLAGRMAQRCIETRRRDVAHMLASGWIVSGRVEQGRTVAVQLGNKLAVPRMGRWLLPLDNFADLPPRSSGLSIQSAVDEDSAWSHVSGEGLCRGTESPWPDDIRQLDILIGANIKAAVVSALFMPKKADVTLWTSTAFLPTARAFMLVTGKLRPDLNIGEAGVISSDSIADAEKPIRREVHRRYSNKRSLFNITSGNLLMRLAVDAVARLFPHVELVYRDIDAPRYVLSRIDYRRFPPEVGTYRGEPESLRGLNANFLFGRGEYDKTRSAETIAADFLNKTIENKGS